MFLTEFDEEAYGKAMRSEGYEEGHEEGLTTGNSNGRKEYNCLVKALMERNRVDDLKRAITDEGFLQQLFCEFGIDRN